MPPRVIKIENRDLRNWQAVLICTATIAVFHVLDGSSTDDLAVRKSRWRRLWKVDVMLRCKGRRTWDHNWKSWPLSEARQLKLGIAAAMMKRDRDARPRRHCLRMPALTPDHFFMSSRMRAASAAQLGLDDDALLVEGPAGEYH